MPYPYTRQDAVTFVARQVLLDRSAHAAWAVTLDGVSIGGINIRMHCDHALAEMGWSIARAQWGKGFGTGAALAVRDEAFRLYPDLNKIRATADARNVASHRVMEKLGMTREGVLRQNRIFRGQVADEVWYGILRSEWNHRLVRR